MHTFNKMIISEIQEHSCGESTGVDVPTSSKRPHTEYYINHLMVTLQLLRTIHLIIVPNHQVKIRIVLNNQIITSEHSSDNDGSVHDHTLPSSRRR